MEKSQRGHVGGREVVAISAYRWAVFAVLCAGTAHAADLPRLTTLSDDGIKYVVPELAYAVLRRGDVEAIVVDNRAVDDGVLTKHKAGYSGVAVLKHRQRGENLFVENYAGLNFEHILDGTTQPPDVLFEPRRAPLELRVIGPHVVELYQAPTPHYGLESCSRYELLDDGVIQLTFECIPRRKTFVNGYIGLFWASYIQRPESLDIHFRGFPRETPAEADWVRGVTPAHGQLSTHLGANDRRELAHAENYPLTLVYNLSNYRYAEPWYYGVSHGLALAQIFRVRDQVRFSQSPSGGGQGNPAWDFQFIVPDYQVGERYQLVMRAAYVPTASPAQMRELAQRELAELEK